MSVADRLTAWLDRLLGRRSAVLLPQPVPVRARVPVPVSVRVPRR